MDTKKRKKSNGKNKKKKENKERVDIDFTDFSFLGPPAGIVNHDLFKITDSDLNASASLKLLYDEFISPRCLPDDISNTDEVDLHLLKADDCETISYKLKDWDKLHPQFPEVSSLSKQQHSQCLCALEILTSSCEPNTNDEKDNIETFHQLQLKRVAEYEKFSVYVENTWKTKNNVRLLEIQSSLKCYINEYWRYRLTRVLSYPEKYRIASMLPLQSNLGNCKQIHIEAFPQDVVYECGIQDTLSLPTKKWRIVNDYVELKSKAPVAEKTKSVSRAPVSRDKVAANLAKKYEADVVISSSGLKCLLDNHPPNYNRDWILPIEVKELMSDTDYKKRKVIFVDKPLPLTKYSVQQLNQWVHKVSLKASLISGDKVLTQSSSDILVDGGNNLTDISNSREQMEDSELINQISNNLNKQEEIPSNFEKTSSNKMGVQNLLEQENNTSSKWAEEILPPAESVINNGHSKSRKYRTCNDDDSDSDNLLIDESSEGEHTPGRARVTRSMTKTKCSPLKNSNISPRVVKKHYNPQGENSETEVVLTPEKQQIGEENSNNLTCEKPKSFTPARKCQKFDTVSNCKSSMNEPHTTYRIWKMVKHIDGDESVLKKDERKELKILIRTKSDGKLIQSDGTQQEVILTPKLEYQLEFGAECPSLSECSRQWCSLFFQPCTKILRVRINPQNSEVCSHEVRDLHAITSETFRIHKHNPKNDLNRLFQILNIVSASVLPGTYILKHDVAMLEGAKLYMADNSSDNFQLNLHNLYENVSLDKMALQHFPWNPIDPFLITSKHRLQGILPSMFKYCTGNRKRKMGILEQF